MSEAFIFEHFAPPKLAKSSHRHSNTFGSNVSSSSSVLASVTTPLLPRPNRTSISNLNVGVSVLENKRRSFHESLVLSADLLDTTRRQSRRSMLQNLESTADLLDSKRRGMRKSLGKGLRGGVNRVRGLGKEREIADDESFFCVGEGGAHDSKADEELGNEEEKVEEEPPKPARWPSRKSSLAWVVIGLVARKGELRQSVINDSFVADRNKPLPKLPSHLEDDDTERLSYEDSI